MERTRKNKESILLYFILSHTIIEIKYFCFVYTIKDKYRASLNFTLIQFCKR